MGRQITEDYTNKKLIVFTLADGGIIFAADLIRKIDIPIEFYTIVVKSYGVNETSNKPKVLYFPKDIDWTIRIVTTITTHFGKFVYQDCDFIRVRQMPTIRTNFFVFR